jgi:serine/threonine protein phosphatase PrpC
VDDEVIAETLSGNGTLESKCKRLVQAARDAGGPDNITAVLLQAH